MFESSKKMQSRGVRKLKSIGHAQSMVLVCMCMYLAQRRPATYIVQRRAKATLREFGVRKVYPLEGRVERLSPVFCVTGGMARRMLYPMADEVARNWDALETYSARGSLERLVAFRQLFCV